MAIGTTRDHLEPGEVARVERWTVEMSPRLHKELEAFARAFGGDRAEVFRRALGLYKLAVEAQNEGKTVGIIGPDGAVETEFTGL